MNKVKRQINKVQEAISEVDFRVTCKAQSNGFSTPVELLVSGLDSESGNLEIIQKVREVAAICVMGKIDPEDVSEVVSKMACPIECKAWVISVLWFSFYSENGEEHQQAWMKVYRRWESDFSRGYDDKVLRNEMLASLGLPMSWINKRAATKKQLTAMLLRVGLVPVGK